MGWNSANEIFDPVAQALIDLGASNDVKVGVLSPLIYRLQQEDWDTESESLEWFEDDPAIVEAFRLNGVSLEAEDG